MAELSYFTALANFKAIVADTPDDGDADPDLTGLTGTVTFTAALESGDLVLATGLTAGPTGLMFAPIQGCIDSDGIMKLGYVDSNGDVQPRTTPWGAYSYTPVRLVADTATLELEEALWYNVTFSNMSYNGKFVSVNGFSFQAPNGDIEFDLIENAIPGPGVNPIALTRLAPEGVRIDGDDMVFTFGGVDIPDPVPLSLITGPMGATGATGSTGATGAPGEVTLAGVQTLTNKTISGANNTFSAIPQSAVTGLDAHVNAAIRQGYNLAYNADFEYDNLTLLAGSSYDTTIKRYGTRSVKVQNLGGNYVNFVPATTMRPTDIFYVELYVYGAETNTLSTGTLEIDVLTYDGSGGIRHHLLQLNASPSLNGVWTKMSGFIPVTLAATKGGSIFFRTASVPSSEIYYIDSPLITNASQIISQLQDVNGNAALQITGASGAVNYLAVTANVTGSAPRLTAVGSDTNISLDLLSKGSGTVKANGVDVVTTTGTQALTNKTLTSPTITGTNFIQRSVATATGPVMLGSSQATDYVTFAKMDEAVALLHLDGASGSTTITDSGRLASNWTAAGNAQISTAQSVSGGASLYLDGAGDYITQTADASNFAFAGDFTVEFWARPTTATSAGGRVLFDTRPNGTNGWYPGVHLTTTGVPVYFLNGTNRITGGSALADNTWYHIALCRSGSSTKLFVDGTQVGSTYTDSTPLLCAANRPYIGENSAASGYVFEGHIDGVRILNGHAAYTAAFTPPVRHGDRFEDASTAVGTVALLHCNGASGSTSVVDSGVLQSNWTAVGNAAISTAQSAFGGASLYLDGTGDYIRSTAPSSSFVFGSGDFCIELMVYITTLKTAFIYDARTESTTGSNRAAVYINSSGQVRFNANGTDRILGTVSMSVNTWYHVAISRSGTSTRLWVNGVQDGSTWTDSTVYESDATRVIVGANAINYGQAFEGYLEEVRISRIARYTAPFTPPAAPHPDVPVIGLPSAASNSNRYTIVNKGTIPILSAASIGTQTIDGTTTFEIDPDVSQEFIPVNSSWSKV